MNYREEPEFTNSLHLFWWDFRHYGIRTAIHNWRAVRRIK